MVKQCKFKDKHNNVNGGFLCDFDNGDKYIICGCCGGIFDLNEVEILEIYDNWINLSHEITGE